MPNDKFRLNLIAIATVMLLATTLLYGVQISAKKEVNLGSLIPFLIPLIIIIFMAFFIFRRYKDIKQGMPLEDERSKKVMANAVATSFYISLYWLLIISMFESFFAKMFGAQKLDASQTVGGAIAGMAIIFIICWFYYEKKGKLT